MRKSTDGSVRYEAVRRYLFFGRHCSVVTLSISSIMLPVKKLLNKLLDIQWNFIMLRSNQEVPISMLQSTGLNDQT